MPTTTSLISRVREYIDETDEDNTHFDNDQIISFLNQAIRFMGTDLEWPIQTAQATSVQDQAVYTLPENFVSLLDIYFDDLPLTVLDRSDLKQINSQWQDTPSGTPAYAYRSDNRKFGLWPKPDADHSDLVIQIQYIKIPIDLASDDDTPDLHVALQDCLPFYAAYICEKSLGNTKRAAENLNDYATHKKTLTTKVQRFSDDLNRFRWPSCL